MLILDNIGESEHTKEIAKQHLDQGNYPLAKTTSEDLWENTNKNDVYRLFDYRKALRKVGESLKFIEICRLYNDDPKIIKNQHIK